MQDSISTETPAVEPAPDRFIRQHDLVPLKVLEKKLVTVIGVGAIGRQLVIQLAAIGVPRMQLIDFDKVELTNITTQGYLNSEIGELKVDAAKAMISAIDPDITVETLAEAYKPAHAIGHVVFSCVDTMDARQAIWNAAKGRCDLWIDGRMNGETIRVLTSGDPEGQAYYERSLFSDEQAERGRCTARGAIYTAGIAAGLMVQQLTRWMRDFPMDNDVVLNLLSSEITVNMEDEVAAAT